MASPSRVRGRTGVYTCAVTISWFSYYLIHIIILEKGADGEVYNIVNEKNTMTICEMAQLVASKIAKDRIKVEIRCEDNRKTGYAPKTGLRMSSEKLCALGWIPQKSLIEMYEDVIGEIKSRLV